MVRTFWYSDGLIQFTAGEHEPRAARWDHVISLTVRIVRADESADYIGSSTICDDDGGTSLTARGAATACEASRILIPKPVPPLIRAFDAGEPVTVGDMRIDRSGITDASRTDGAEPVFGAWSDIRRIPRGEAPAALAARAGRAVTCTPPRSLPDFSGILTWCR